ncbi:MAG TPA: glycosyltransferase [Phycisphaerales bacterium]|nr:glycosyltransferase [Phycisphaerales bacterium]
MRILHISTRLILGGSQENTVLSCEGQARLGHEVHLAFGPIYGPEGSLLERVGGFRTEDGRGIATHAVPHMVREVSPLADRRALGELRRLIRDVSPDIVHTHSSKAGVLGRAAAWQIHEGTFVEERRPKDIRPEIWNLVKAGRAVAAKLRALVGIPAIVHTIHGPPFMPIEGGAASRARIRLKNWMYTRAERYAARRCHVIVSVADAMTREFLARGIGRPEQYVTVRSGMEVGPYLEAAPGETCEEVRKRLGLAPSDFVVGTVARLAEHKGHDDLLDALAGEMKRNARLKLLWVGDGWWRARLMERVRGLGLESSVVTTGLVEPARIPGLIRAMDLLAHPSYREGLPRTVPQALLCGVCPAAYDCDGTAEVCREMETGRLVRVGDRDGLREALLWLMSHPRERGEMAARGREECRTAFSAETMVAELEGAYARAIEIARG